MLSDSEGSDEQSLHKLTINEHYAKAFEYKKEREELQKLKDKYGSDFEDDEDGALESDSESDESEDEDGEELTPTVDAAIFRTLARIKRKDPAIYDAKTNIYGEEHEKVAPATKRTSKDKDKSKPVTIRQVALQAALNSESRSPSPEPLPHAEEQRALRDETIAAFHNALEDEDSDLFVPREKTKDEQALEEEEYRAFLEREVGKDLKDLVGIQDVDHPVTVEENSPVSDEVSHMERRKKKAKDGKNTSSSKSKEEADQEFLMNYILNRGWVDRTTKHIPTYGEITSQTKGKAKEDGTGGSERGEETLPTADPDLDEEDFEEIVDRFESSYNFRFEEPDAAIIPSYPRNLPSLVRREDTTRKDARERRKKRKEEEIQHRREEVKRLKGLKMKEIRSRLEKIGKEGGKSLDADKALRELDLDAEWDSAAHDRQMAELYGDDDFGDDEKPRWDDDIDIGDIALDEEVLTVPTKKDKKKKKKKNTEEVEESGVDVDAMDADFEGVIDDEEWDGTEEMRKRKLNEYMDELYGLDFNDIVGDMPTRFNYVPVQPQNFALTPVEILMATDQELNEYMSVKKYAPYRQETKWDSKRNDRLKELKKKIVDRMGSDTLENDRHTDTGNGDKPAKKRKGKKERMKLKQAGEGVEEPKASNDTDDPSSSKRKRDPTETVDTGEGEQEVSTSKKKRRRKHKGGET